LNAWLCPMMHPSGVNRSLSQHLPIFEDDLRQVVSLIKNPRRFPTIRPYKIEKITNFDDIMAYLRHIYETAGMFYFDFETVNFRPFYKDSKLVSCAATTDGITAVSFPIEKSGCLIPKQQRQVKQAFGAIIANPNIHKGMHNYGMEGEWCEGRHLKVKIQGPIDDTQRMAYVLDVRRKCHSLAFITLCNFGIRWKDMVARYITNMDKCPIDLLLEYGGLDVIWGFRNYELMKHRLEVNPSLKRYYEEIVMPGAKACVVIERRGALPDVPFIEGMGIALDKKIIKKAKKLRADKNIRKFEQRRRERMNFNSDAQVRKLLYDFMNLPKRKMTSTDADIAEEDRTPSVDADVLKQHSKKDKVKFCIDLLDYRDYSHQKSTWVEGILSQVHLDGMLHQELNNTFTRTGRLSSNNPDLQNYPIRKKRHRLIRNSLVAPPGYVIASFDFEQLEAVCLAIESGDIAFKAGLREGYDIHLAKGIEIFGPKRGPKERSLIKNGFTFPVVYTAGPVLVAKNLGITKQKAAKHIEKLWDDHPQIYEFQQTRLQFYEEHHYVESRTGHRRYGPLYAGKIVNTPIQNLAASICIRGMIIGVKRGYWIWSNVHDELNFYLPERTLERDLVRISRFMTTLPTEWVDDVQIKVGCKIGYKWGELEKVTV